MADSSRDSDAPPPGRPAYLPRMVYTPPTPKADAPEPPAKPAKKKAKDDPAPASSKGSAKSSKGKGKEDVKEKNKGKAKGADGEPKRILKEETPEFDTYDARRKVRLMVGAGLGVVLLLTGFLVVRAFRGEPEPDLGELPAEFPDAVPSAKVGVPKDSKLEGQAKALLAEARQFAEAGTLDPALMRLKTIGQAYPKTKAAEEAKAAQDRHKQGLPLFGPALIATKVDPPPEPKAPEVAAVPPEPAAPPGTATVVATPPPVPPEPRAQTGLVMGAANVPPRLLPPGFRPRAEAGVHTSGWPLEITCDRDGASLVFIPGGEFTMGRNDGPPSERPAHRVQLPPYYIDQHEVTVGQYRHYQQSKGEAAGTPGADQDRRPVVEVSLKEAQAYALWAGKAIPTEAQWELAARTTDGRLHPWGNGPPIWGRREPKQIDPALTYPTDLSPYGAFDLAGNAWEWTTDWFDTKYYAQFKDAPAINPTGPPRSRARIPEVVVKGGSKDWDASWRSGMPVEAKTPYLGFRCVLPVEALAPGPAVPMPQPATGAPATKGQPAQAVPF